jgi:hypothetical protein
MVVVVEVDFDLVAHMWGWAIFHRPYLHMPLQYRKQSETPQTMILPVEIETTFSAKFHFL